MADVYVIGHPEDIDTPAAKALCAEYGANYVANPYLPRGQVILGRLPGLLLPKGGWS